MTLRQLPERIIKTWGKKIILMQDVHPFSARTLDAGIPTTRQTKILWRS